MQKPIIDSAMNLEEALLGKEFPKEIHDTLVLVDVVYVSFDNQIHQGQIVIHKTLATETKDIFQKLFESRFPISQIIPIVKYAWNDEASMAANNTSGFNFRLIYGTNQVSNHAFGRAIDINPIQNPYVRADGSISPSGAIYDVLKPGTITEEIAQVFLKRGWKWGGNWEQKDWQHFEKTAPLQ